MLLATTPKIFISSFFVIIIISISNTTILGDPSWVAERPRRLKEIIKQDLSRCKWIYQKPIFRASTTKFRRLTDEDDIPIEYRKAPLKSIIKGAVKLPMYGAAEYRIGEYVVDINIGDPPTTLHLVVDTASDFTWIKCKKNNRGILTEKGFFDADKSSSFKPIECDTTLCKHDFIPFAALPNCPTAKAPCLYNFSYGEHGLATYGTIAKETATLPTTTNNTVNMSMIFGCSESYSDTNRLKHVDGVIGLGVHPYSFAIQAANNFGGTFSYCLVDHLSPLNITNFLIFGNYREKSPTNQFMRYTAILMSDVAPYYWLNVKAITIDNKILDIDPVVWDNDSGGGTILDTGSAATYWPPLVYRAIMDVLRPALEKDHPKLTDWSEDGISGFEYCFNSTLTPFDPKKVPRLEIHFKDGARFRPHVKSYVLDDGPDVNCIGFLESRSGLNIIGNIMQQNYLWEYDLQELSVGFVSSTCE